MKPMTKTFATITGISAALLLSACNTEAEETETAPIDDMAAPPADAPGVGMPNAEGDAEPAQPLPEDELSNDEMSEPEPPSGAEATNDIEY